MNRAILGIAAWLVPRAQRRDWHAEWTSELWYVARCQSRQTTLAFCLGAFADAMWLRRNYRGPARADWLESPSQCLLYLTLLAAASVLLSNGMAWRARPQPILADLLILMIAVLILPATTSLAMGEYPAVACAPTRAAHTRRWIFLGLKLGLILPAVFFGTFDLTPIVGSVLQPQATLIGYVLGFRWALSDQRRRCPVCLRLLTNPIRIGQRSQTLLEWYGTEFLCNKGHGVLHVPGIQASYTIQRWVALDASWSSLF
jgi:hypothetical protein